MSSLTTKIEKIGNSWYYRCQWTGALRKSRYQIPSEKPTGLPKGTFVDPPCAAAWVKKQLELGAIDEDKGRKLLRAIHVDCQIKPNQNMQCAPEMNPENLDFSYQNDIDFMMHPRSGYSHISKDKAVSDKEQKTKSKSASGGEFHLYTIDPADTEGENLDLSTVNSHLLSSKNGVALEFMEKLSIAKIVKLEFKNKACFLLSEENSTQENLQVTNMFKKKNQEVHLFGTVHILMFKKLHNDGKSDGEVTIQNKQQKVQKKDTKEQIEIKIDNSISSFLSLPPSNEESRDKSSSPPSSKPGKKRSRKE
jgi:hypothetical protein